MRMPADCQIERIPSIDLTRQNLSAGVFYEPDRKRITATDGHMLVSVPVQPDPEDHKGYITGEAIKAARQAFKKRGTDPQILANGSQVIPGGPTFPRPSDDLKFPPVDQVIPAYRKGDKGTITLCLNATLLLDIAKALGATGKVGARVSLTIPLPKPTDAPSDGQSVEEMTFGESLDPIVVLGGCHDALGVLMPCRL